MLSKVSQISLAESHSEIKSKMSGGIPYVISLKAVSSVSSFSRSSVVGGKVPSSAPRACSAGVASLAAVEKSLKNQMEHFLTHVGKLLLLLQLQVDRRPFLPHHAVIQRKMLACFTHRHGQKHDVLLRWKPPYRHLLLLIETCVLFKFVCVCSLRCDASDYTLRRPTKILVVSVIRCGMLRLKTTYLWVEYDLKALGILKASDDFREGRLAIVLGFPSGGPRFESWGDASGFTPVVRGFLRIGGLLFGVTKVVVTAGGAIAVLTDPPSTNLTPPHPTFIYATENPTPPTEEAQEDIKLRFET
ncbi:hypothetical protein LXL04_014619 [Taraxacum kok-saghyz]